MSSLKDYPNQVRKSQSSVSAPQSTTPMSSYSSATSVENLHRTQQTQIWDHWNEAQRQQESRKSVRELHNDAYRAYRQDQYELAASLFAQAAELARQQGDTAAQAKNLRWEGDALYLDDHLAKALKLFLDADFLNALDTIDSFRNLLNIVKVAKEIPSPLAEQRKLLEKLEPYKGSRQIGGSKSMVLNVESDLLSDCGKDSESLAKSQEAFASRVSQSPMYNDMVYFEDLVTSYRIASQYAEARNILQQWKTEATYVFAGEKSRILKAEARILSAEGHTEAAWDLMQQVYAEERYIQRAGKNTSTMSLMILIGSKLGHFDQIRPLVLRMLRFRHSESLHTRYSCYLSVARYCCRVCIHGGMSDEDAARMHRHARFWLQRAETTARQLDQLLECDWHTKQIQSLRDLYSKTVEI